VGEQYHGFIISMPALFFIVSGNLVGLFTDKYPKRFILLFAFGLVAISNFLMGPSALLSLPRELWIYFVGYGINGFAQGLVFVPLLPEVLEAVYQEKGFVEGDDPIMDGIINDKAAALHGIFYAIGAIAAPLLGSFVYETILVRDWWYTCDVFGIISTIFAVIFFIFNVLPDIHKDR
jgi:MFS family permease